MRRPRRGPPGARDTPRDRDRRHCRRARASGSEAGSVQRPGRAARLEPDRPHAGRGRRGDPPGHVGTDRARHHELGHRPAARGARTRRRRHRAPAPAHGCARLHHPASARHERGTRTIGRSGARAPRGRGQDRDRLLAQGRGRTHDDGLWPRHDLRPQARPPHAARRPRSAVRRLRDHDGPRPGQDDLRPRHDVGRPRPGQARRLGQRAPLGRARDPGAGPARGCGARRRGPRRAPPRGGEAGVRRDRRRHAGALPLHHARDARPDGPARA